MDLQPTCMYLHFPKREESFLQIGKCVQQYIRAFLKGEVE